LVLSHVLIFVPSGIYIIVRGSRKEIAVTNDSFLTSLLGLWQQITMADPKMDHEKGRLCGNSENHNPQIYHRSGSQLGKPATMMELPELNHKACSLNICKRVKVIIWSLLDDQVVISQDIFLASYYIDLSLHLFVTFLTFKRTGYSALILAMTSQTCHIEKRFCSESSFRLEAIIPVFFQSRCP
jgi:hypothetical protein